MISNATLNFVFPSLHETYTLKNIFFLFLFLSAFIAEAQEVESIHVNLYTDSLKKGTHNYISIDGKLTNGRYIPLDSSYLSFRSSAGTFSGNNLWIDRETALDQVKIKVTLKKNPALEKEFTVYIKKSPDPELKSIEEVMRKSKKAKN